MPDSLYEHDALAWSEQQADILRRLAAGERLNEKPDWDNIVEEIQDVGLSQLNACRSHLRHALTHLLKLHAEPSSQAANHWRGEIANFLTEARDHFAPSMRQRIDLQVLYADAIFLAGSAAREAADITTIPPACPYTLDDLLTPHINPTTRAARLATP